MRKTVLLLLVLCGGGVWAQSAPRYSVRLAQMNPPRVDVSASVVLKTPVLMMDRTRPGDVPGVGKGGWPALVADLHVTDAQGHAHAVRSKGPAGWELEDGYTGAAQLHYSIRYDALASAAWPAPREAAYQDGQHFIAIGRSMFITADGSDAGTRVRFEAPKGWKVFAPWKSAGCASCFEVATAADLTENLLVFSTERPEVVKAGNFTVTATLLGPWKPVTSQVRELLTGVIPQYVSIFGSSEPQQYSMVLLPQPDQGGESYRASFAFNVEEKPTAENRDVWGHTIAHEIFHYWNGWRLRGADYASSQWFQEGFTEYGADLAMLNAHLLTAEQFQKRLAGYVGNYERLTTPLAHPGTHKGPPLYSGGALVAYAWDQEIRKKTNGQKDLRDVYSALWRDTQNGASPYGWPDIRKALEAVAAGEWQEFYDRYIDGSERLPLREIMKL